MVVNGAVCDPTALAWVATPQVVTQIDVSTGPTDVSITPYTVDVPSKSSTPQMIACTSFDETFTLVAVDKANPSQLPDFITHDGNGKLTVTPRDHRDIGVWTIQVTQDPVNGVTSVWDAVKITVDCTVTSITP